MMNTEDITLEILLLNKKIRSARFEDDWYFCKDDVNAVYGNNFKLTGALPLPLKTSPKKRTVMMCMSFTDIMEQVEHYKSIPPFEADIEKLFKRNN